MSGIWIFVGLVFLAVFLALQGLSLPVFGENRRVQKRLKTRLAAVSAGATAGSAQTLVREKYLKRLTPFEQQLESLPGMEGLAALIEQAGRTMPGYRLPAAALALATVAAVSTWLATHLWYFALLFAAAAFAVPFARMLQLRNQRIARFEAQLPEALDVIKRGLRAGHPFTQCLKLIAEDMDEPISREFDSVFTEVRYGGDLRTALLALLQRIPSVSLVAFVTAVLLQKETGGNLAETLERISAVIRGRFKLYRHIRTLSAEGRLSAWVLLLVPLMLFGTIWFTSPGYLPTLLHNPDGPPMIAAACVLAVIGMIWIRNIIRIVV